MLHNKGCEDRYHWFVVSVGEKDNSVYSINWDKHFGWGNSAGSFVLNGVKGQKGPGWELNTTFAEFPFSVGDYFFGLITESCCEDCTGSGFGFHQQYVHPISSKGFEVAYMTLEQDIDEGKNILSDDDLEFVYGWLGKCPLEI